MCTRVRQSGRGWHWALILTRHVGGGRLLADHGHTVVIPLAHTGRLGDALLKGVLPLVREAHPHVGVDGKWRCLVRSGSSRGGLKRVWWPRYYLLGGGGGGVVVVVVVVVVVMVCVCVWCEAQQVN